MSWLNKKWRFLQELNELLLQEDCIPGIYNKAITLITYAPEIGHNMWIVKYNGLYVALYDEGNSWYKIYSIVSRWNVLLNKLSVKKLDRVVRR